ncbi:MAG: sugar-binding domain-containing protein [Armatimonadota bacterium]|nr:hypothetical protein [bacterium]
MKNTMSLNGSWQLISEGVDAVTAQVPGDIHSDLLRAGKISDPYYGMNAEDAQWVERKEWRYSREFNVDDDFLQKQTYLEFEGLDTFATVFLNGDEIGQTHNMFVPQGFDVSDKVTVGRNTLEVKFDPAVSVLELMDLSRYEGCFNRDRVGARKMQCAFGWDWTPRLVGAGIWREVRLASYDSVSINNIRVETEIEGGQANAWVYIEVENHTREDRRVSASVVISKGENREKIEVTDSVEPFGGVIEAVIRIEEPELWWPNGMGEPSLYNCMVGISCEGEVQDVAETEFGVRDVRFIELDENGERIFTLLVNGEKVFCKGANWVPADHLVSRVTDERYHELVGLAKDANFNMLRVWGGGVYEGQAFYRACDEMGIMVWQDFMFACATYPDAPGFNALVADEVRTIVKELRNHPSVVVWCGNNECEMDRSPDVDWPGKSLFHKIIPDVLKGVDCTRPYLPGSPYGGSTGNDPSVGDWHGGVWRRIHDEDHMRWLHMIEEEKALFVSEFYGLGSPEIESLREFIPEDRIMPPDSDVMGYHNKDGMPSHKNMIELTRKMMGEFKSAEEFAAYSGILQGELLKAEIEHYRREKWNISGALYWMFNDSWPAISWSLVDYYLRPKAAYYYAKRAFEPVIVSFKQLDDRVRVYVTTDDRLQAIDAMLQVGVMTFDACGMEVEEVPVRIEPNSSGMVWESEPLESVFSDTTRQCMVAMLEMRGEIIARGVYFARPWSEIQFPKPKLLVHREQLTDTTHEMVISVDAYARNLAISNLPAGARPSDNYFDVVPGEQKTVTIRNINIEQANELKLNVWKRASTL